MMSLLTRGTVGPVSRGTAGLPSDHTKRPDGSSAHPTLAADTTVIRVAFWAGQLATILGIIRAAAAEFGLDPAISGSAAAGVLDVSVDHDAPSSAVGDFVDALRVGLSSLAAEGGVVPGVASAVVLCAPKQVRDSVDLWGPVHSLRLMRAVKDQFDPDHRLAPGRFAGGI
jgi:glycolate dehydrogenase FAD-binding subunit